MAFSSTPDKYMFLLLSNFAHNGYYFTYCKSPFVIKFKGKLFSKEFNIHSISLEEKAVGSQ